MKTRNTCQQLRARVKIGGVLWPATVGMKIRISLRNPTIVKTHYTHVWFRRYGVILYMTLMSRLTHFSLSWLLNIMSSIGISSCAKTNWAAALNWAPWAPTRIRTAGDEFGTTTESSQKYLQGLRLPSLSLSLLNRIADVSTLPTPLFEDGAFSRTAKFLLNHVVCSNPAPAVWVVISTSCKKFLE